MNYIGSKQSLLQFIKYNVDNVTGFGRGEGHTFADLFAGTGIVGTMFKENGYHVIANDMQYYSYVLAKHNICNTFDNVDAMDNGLLFDLNYLEGTEGFIYENYCMGSGSERNYFTDENGMLCDSIRIELELMRKSGKLSDNMYYYILASLLNSIDKYANTTSVYCAFLKHMQKSAQKPFQIEPLPIIEGTEGEVYNEDACQLIHKISGDILYLDPPYNERQYCTNYHLLETIAKYDNPQIQGIAGLREHENQKSAFCSSKTCLAALEEIISAAKFKYIFLSYNNEGLMTLEDIAELMSKYGEYQCFTTDYKRYKADSAGNRNIKGDRVTEYLHCVVKE